MKIVVNLNKQPHIFVNNTNLQHFFVERNNVFRIPFHLMIKKTLTANQNPSCFKELEHLKL